MFAEANEFAGAVVLSSGVDIQTAYSVTDHVALMANVNILEKKYSTPDFNRNHRFFEGGLGYFTRTKPMRFEMFGGYGAGSGNSFESFYFFGKKELVAKGSYNRIFFQPSIGTNKKKFNIYFTSRLSMVKFTSFTTDDPDAVTPVAPRDATNDKYSLFIEPAITTRFHLVGNLRGFFQLSINQPIGDVYFDYTPVQGAIGIQLHTGQLRTRVY